MAALSTSTVKRGDDLKQTTRVSDGGFGSSSTDTFMPQVLFRWGRESCGVRCIGTIT